MFFLDPWCWPLLMSVVRFEVASGPFWNWHISCLSQGSKKNILRTGNKSCTVARLHSGARGAFAGPANPGHKEGHMAQNTLRVVEGGAMDKTKALEAALSQIDRAFGKGSVMKLGKGEDGRDRVDFDRLARPRHRARHRRPAEGPGGRDLRAGKLRQDHARPARGGRGAEARRHRRPSSTPSTRSTRPTPTSWGSISTICWSPSPTPASRRWRSPTPWCARARWTSWSSTRWRP